MRDTEAATFYASRSKEENELRKMLFLQHSHGNYSACLYGDDSEMQCSVCYCDFVRDSTETLNKKTYSFGMQELVRLGLIKPVGCATADEVKR